MNLGIYHEFWRLVAYLGLGLLLGMPWDLSLAGAFVGFALFFWRHFKRLLILQDWLANEAKLAPPESDGIWGDLFDQLYRYQKGQQRIQERLQSVIDRIQESSSSLRDAVVMVDRQGELEWWNTAAERLLGFRAPDDDGQPITNLLRDPRFIEYFEQGEYQEPLTLPSPMLDSMMLQYQISVFGDNDRLMLVRDITRLHRLEQMRKDFVANVSHELRTPLTVLVGYLETYQEYQHQLPPRWQKGVTQMRQQTLRMQNLVNDLLTLSRLETSDVEEEILPIAVDHMLQSIRQDALALSGEKQHQIILYADANVRLYGSEKELRSAFSNLVFNAIKYTPAQSEIQIRWYADIEGAHLEVVDNGEGIDSRHLPRLTERFYRVDKGRSTESGGTGLGLAIVKHVLLRHQGWLDIHSEIGLGCEFICHFPRARVADFS
ncbi:two-component system, OmpR family, phosphate regulon sensor histidine kinase PhoR [Allopseudospirillum japonicum]|uniref:Phosphate regulon sensor protein PhoR n=1 Tax=Allopseudospirillum japonicum TaxID=64971 RepID=A0A1H6RAU8_9GAMM|nr:phosphate regulon sensor histidine kinase PhoR [Allopseudospirillum japonicum]SEI52959.1 two-component system, OmpR family, phosphate regulon sensor histidine kinase PhoR [Allopseudospirillum japonicum]